MKTICTAVIVGGLGSWIVGSYLVASSIGVPLFLELQSCKQEMGGEVSGSKLAGGKLVVPKSCENLAAKGVLADQVWSRQGR